jgi:hypothetical protein
MQLKKDFKFAVGWSIDTELTDIKDQFSRMLLSILGAHRKLLTK